jgi:hypothetical protein
MSWMGREKRTNGSHAIAPPTLERLHNVESSGVDAFDPIARPYELDAGERTGSGERREGLKVVEGEYGRAERLQRRPEL